MSNAQIILLLIACVIVGYMVLRYKQGNGTDSESFESGVSMSSSRKSALQVSREREAERNSEELRNRMSNESERLDAIEHKEEILSL